MLNAMTRNHDDHSLSLPVRFPQLSALRRGVAAGTPAALSETITAPLLCCAAESGDSGTSEHGADIRGPSGAIGHTGHEIYSGSRSFPTFPGNTTAACPQHAVAQAPRRASKEV